MDTAPATPAAPVPAGPGRVVPMLEIDATLPAADGAADTLWSESVALVRGWIEGGTGAPAAGVLPHGGALGVWACAWEAEDGAFPGRCWSSEAALLAEPGGVRLLVQSGLRAAAPPRGVEPVVPGFVPLLADRFGLAGDGLALGPAAIGIGTDLSEQRFLDLLRDPARRHPLVVVSAADSSPQPRYLEEPADLAALLTGLAPVLSLGFRDAHRLTERLGKSWSVFHGGIRVYRPGFDPARDGLYDHPLILGRQLQSAEGRADARARLLAAVARVPAAPGAEPRLSPLQRARRLLPPADPPPPAPEARIGALEAERESALALAADEEARARAAHAALQEIRIENAALREKIRRLERRGAAGFAEPVSPLSPASYRDLAAWADEAFPGRLFLSAKARRALARAEFQDIALVCEALALLAGAYVEMKRSGGREAWAAGLLALHLGDEAIAASPAHHRNEEQYWCTHEGRDIFTDRHLKKGKSRDPRESLRIYYGWDEETQMVVIGHLPSHLTTTIS